MNDIDTSEFFLFHLLSLQDIWKAGIGKSEICDSPALVLTITVYLRFSFSYNKMCGENLKKNDSKEQDTI